MLNAWFSKLQKEGPLFSGSKREESAPFPKCTTTLWLKFVALPLVLRCSFCIIKLEFSSFWYLSAAILFIQQYYLSWRTYEDVDINYICTTNRDFATRCNNIAGYLRYSLTSFLSLSNCSLPVAHLPEDRLTSKQITMPRSTERPWQNQTSHWPWNRKAEKFKANMLSNALQPLTATATQRQSLLRTSLSLSDLLQGKLNISVLLHINKTSNNQTLVVLQNLLGIFSSQ